MGKFVKTVIGSCMMRNYSMAVVMLLVFLFGLQCLSSAKDFKLVGFYSKINELLAPQEELINYFNPSNLFPQNTKKKDADPSWFSGLYLPAIIEAQLTEKAKICCGAGLPFMFNVGFDVE